MKIKIKKIIYYTILLISVLFIFHQNEIINKKIIYATQMFYYKVFPSLFVMSIISYLLISKLTRENNRLISKYITIILLFISILVCVPTNVLLIEELLNNNNISNEDAKILIQYTSFINPLFLINMIYSTLGRQSLIRIILAYYISNLFFIKKINFNTNSTSRKNSSVSLLISKSITKACNVSISCLGIIVFFILLTIPVSFMKNNIVKVALYGLFEITQGLSMITKIDVLIVKELLFLLIISFNGLAMHMQVFNVSNNDINLYSSYLKGRLKACLISTLIYLIITLI
jgi:hypothetical protein